ncbi:MAG: dipeptidase [Candidatus Acidiferrales bacterium]
MLSSPLLALAGVGGAFSPASAAADSIERRARDLHFRSLVVDSHVDVAQRFLFERFDMSRRGSEGSVDIPRLREGGVGALFCAAWIPAKESGPLAVKRALDLLDAVREQVRSHPGDLALAITAEDVRRAHREGKIALVLCVEGGHMIDNDLAVLRAFAALGARYMTLTHFADIEWAGSSGGLVAAGGNKGLSEFGREVVREMNRLGMVVDVSHASDRTFADVLETSRAPVMASHSCCRAICPAMRNLSDDMIRALAARGGLLQIAFHVGFLSEEYHLAMREAFAEFDARSRASREKFPGNEARLLREDERLSAEMVREGKLPPVKWEKIVEHLNHAVQLVGAEHAGLGSDFDGAFMPEGMEDASMLPRITEAMLRRGYSEDDVRKILGENVLRVMADAERVAQETAAGAKP